MARSEINDGMKTMFITTYAYEGQPKSVITHETDAVTLDELLEAFECHLQGCGFSLQGKLDLIKEDMVKVNEEE